MHHGWSSSSRYARLSKSASSVSYRGHMEMVWSIILKKKNACGWRKKKREEAFRIQTPRPIRHWWYEHLPSWKWGRRHLPSLNENSGKKNIIGFSMNRKILLLLISDVCGWQCAIHYLLIQMLPFFSLEMRAHEKYGGQQFHFQHAHFIIFRPIKIHYKTTSSVTGTIKRGCAIFFSFYFCGDSHQVPRNGSITID